MKKLIKTIFILPTVLLLLAFLSPMYIRVINIGNILGTVMCIALIVIIAKFEKLVELCKKLCKNKKGKLLVSVVLVVLIFGITCFGATLGSIIYESKGNTDDKDTIIILGCAVRGDIPSVTLSARVNAGCKYLEEHPDSVAVLSGGQGYGENISEAECMYNMLIERGIDKSRLYIEDKSVSTDTNIKNSLAVIDENNLSYNIAIVSSDYHLKRAKMICEDNYDILDVGTISAPCTLLDKPTFFLREVIGVVKEFIF